MDHGTHVAGTMAAKDNSVGVVGVAPDCFLIDAKVFNSGGGALDGDIIEAVVYCTEYRFHVINMSFGSRVPSPPFEPQRQAISDYTNTGGIILAAAGNSSLRMENYPADSFYPAAFPECVSVSSIDENNVPSTFTNFGPPTEICAPGTGILSTVLMGGAKYDFKSGTSMATPNVAGCCALALSNFKWTDCNPIYELGGGGPHLDRGVMIRKLLEQTADKKGVSNPFTGRSEVFGFGVVQVDKMVEKLLLGVVPPAPASTGGTKVEHGNIL